MRIRLSDTPDALARALAAELVRAVKSKPALVLGLPTGRTPLPLYAELAARSRRGQLDLSQASSFNIDEFVGSGGRDDPRSYQAFMRRHLFDHVNMSARRIHFLNGRATDLAAECRRYERAIARAGGIDVLVLGIGANGHVGFNEPGPRLTALTHVAALAGSTRQANADLFAGRAARVPRRGLTMGMATLLRARRIVVIATGASKAGVVARAIEGPLTTQVPASLLQVHGRCEAWLDREAASRLRRFVQ